MRRMLLPFLSAALLAQAQDYNPRHRRVPGRPQGRFFAGHGGRWGRLPQTWRCTARPTIQPVTTTISTAQLITDGIRPRRCPAGFSFPPARGPFSGKSNARSFLDGNVTSAVTLRGAKTWLQLGLEGGDGPLEVDRFDLIARGQASQPQQPGGWKCTVAGSDDGQTWEELGNAAGAERPDRNFNPSWP